MATKTTTIRVPVETRDLLASQAERRGESLSSMLTKLAERETRDAIFAAERRAIIAERDQPEVIAEAEDWEAASGDGID